MKDLFTKSAFGGFVPVHGENGELMMLADESAFYEFMKATMAPPVEVVPETDPLAAKLARHGSVAVYGHNGEHKANLTPSHLNEYVEATGASHDSDCFEPQKAWDRKFSPDF